MELNFDAVKQNFKRDLNALRPSSFLNLKRSSMVRTFLATFLGVGLLTLSMSFLTVGTATYIKGLVYLVGFVLAIVYANEIRLRWKEFRGTGGYFNK